VVRIKIIHLKNGENKIFEVTFSVQESEFKQLAGCLSHIHSFAAETIVEPAKIIKTGARHSSTAWLHFPITYRKQFKTQFYKFTELTCGVVTSKEYLFIIYKVPKG